ncbi:hypothetical protein Vretimale_11591 [Volvox reticuliferus]|uniref:glutathione gamma-glutamylcysteinyltransferase n=1 Tax=Volvox reticuliferus TaxID=1737510 RepID=A0A8J4GGW9_9CHLO|nr:hypothetical protein Vretifemale_14799 [Volvox reticuliferus]GIM07499.1 hypothetical protein Vretimale_11591 [Volvox reticuliferus]
MAQSVNRRTYYKRVLPSPPAIPFSSEEGREIFAEALPLGTMVGFFKLVEQFTTQEEPQYCGLAALSMTLNALGIDPRRTWKGAWRWFSETMLDCCKSMEDVKQDGITLIQAACLARCNGADVSVHRYGTFDGVTYRQFLREVCASEDRHMVVAYSRKKFMQSGDGHFSPIGGYNPVRDMVLILDVARFKYSPHWVRVDELIEAMGLLDPAIGRPRGFLLMSCRRPLESALFTVDLGSVGSELDAFEGEPQQQQMSTCGAAVNTDECNNAGCLSVAVEAATRNCSVTGHLASDSDSLRAQCVAPLSEPQTPEQPLAQPEPRWAAAHRFITREAGSLLRRLLDATIEKPAVDGDEVDTEAHENENQEDTTAELTGARAAASGGVTAGSLAVPSLESLVGALVAMVPIQSVCALLATRPVPRSVGELQKGPCCSCCVGGTEANDAVALAAGTWKTAAPTAAAALAPCNSSLRTPNVEQWLTAAAAAAVGYPAGTVEHQRRVASRPLRSPLMRMNRGEGKASSGGSGVSPSGSSYAAAAAGRGAEVILSPGLDSGDCCSTGGSGVSLSTRSAAATLLSNDRSLHAGSSTSSVSDGSSSNSSGFVRSCCHGEPLEHHCVPPQVQILVADELRFTNMFKLVDYWLRRQAGCTHVQAPDLTAFMRPSSAARTAAPTGNAAIIDANLEPTAAAACNTRSCPDALQGEAATFAPTSMVPVALGSGHRHTSQQIAGPDCPCRNLELPELAAEKVAMALLLLPDAERMLDEVQEQQNGDAPVAMAAAPDGGSIVQALASSPPVPSSCGQARCRKCRQRAARAGDRAAALELLRERWRGLMQMEPLGLFASSPVLKDELAYLRLQVSSIDSQAQQCYRATDCLA